MKQQAKSRPFFSKIQLDSIANRSGLRQDQDDLDTKEWPKKSPQFSPCSPPESSYLQCEAPKR